LNHLRTSTAHWDSALSAGKPVWLIAGDDSHSSSSILECGRTWTMVNVEEKTPDNVLSSLQTGRAYGASGMFADNRNMLRSVEVKDSIVRVQFEDTIDVIAAIADGGKIKKEVRHSSTMECTFSANDSYLLFEAYDTVHQFNIYLNPLIRYNGGSPPLNVFTAKINTGKTILWKFFVSLIFFSLMTALYYKSIVKLLRARSWNKKPVFDPVNSPLV
ncbi:MAG: hypothetical protein PHP42_13525, partial [Bacteroidota bacterium]|nr:hypothetical protein [Bacteroidota bacterium]